MCKFAMPVDQKYDLDKLIEGFVAEMLAQEMLTGEEAGELIGNKEYHGFAIIGMLSDPNCEEADICLSVSNEDHDAFFIQMFNNDFEYLYPVSVLEEYLIKTYSNPGDRVLDFCAGSATTLLAASNLGRGSIGIDADPDIYAKALDRLETSGIQVRKDHDVD